MAAFCEAAVHAVHPVHFALSTAIAIPIYPAKCANPVDEPERPAERIAVRLPFNASKQRSDLVQRGLRADGLPMGLQISGLRHDGLAARGSAHACELQRPATTGRPQP